MLYTSLWFTDHVVSINKVKATGLPALWATCSFPLGDVLLCFQTRAAPQFILSQWLTLQFWLSHLTDAAVKRSKRNSCKKKKYIIYRVLQLNKKKVGAFRQRQMALPCQPSGCSADKGCDRFSVALLAQSHRLTSALSFLLLWLPSELHAEVQTAWVKITQPGSG